MREVKVRKFLKALKDYGCEEVRKTSHGVIIKNPLNRKSTNVPTHQKEIPVWIFYNILRWLDISKKEIEKYF